MRAFVSGKLPLADAGSVTCCTNCCLDARPHRSFLECDRCRAHKTVAQAHAAARAGQRHTARAVRPTSDETSGSRRPTAPIGRSRSRTCHRTRLSDSHELRRGKLFPHGTAGRGAGPGRGRGGPRRRPRGAAAGHFNDKSRSTCRPATLPLRRSLHRRQDERWFVPEDAPARPDNNTNRSPVHRSCSTT